MRQLFLTIITAFATSLAQAVAFAADAPSDASGTGDAATVDSLIAVARSRHLADEPEWHRLMHYARRPFGGIESQADNPAFFLAADGKRDPDAELVATLRRSLSGEVLEPALKGAPRMAAICQYPARWEWLKARLAIPETLIPKVDCTKLDEFRRGMSATSATVVFSGYYADNPSSIFAHVMIRLGRRVPGGAAVTGLELLDHGVTYAANTDGANPLQFVLYSFTGFFTGTFSVVPYYYQVREYSNAESRDLWEYDLDLKPDEVARLVDHIWEMGSTYFDYFYLTENCAYHLLSVLEAAAPRLNLIQRVPFYVMPVDALKAVAAEPGLVNHIRYRPSTLKTLRARFGTLTPEERATFLAIRRADKPAEALPPELKGQTTGPAAESAARILDAVLDDYDNRYFHELSFKTDAAVLAKKRDVLLARTKLPIGGEIRVPVAEGDRPDLGHGSGRFSLGGGFTTDIREPSVSGAKHGERRGFFDGEIRFALHDLRDAAEGYLPASSVEFFRVRAWWRERATQPELRSFTPMAVSSIAPLDELSGKLSWRFALRLRRVQDRRCDDCLAAEALGVAGLSTEPIENALFYAMLGGAGESSQSFALRHATPELATVIGARWRPARGWTIHAEGDWRRVFDADIFDHLDDGSLAIRWDFKIPSWSEPSALEAELSRGSSSQDVLLRWLHYF